MHSLTVLFSNYRILSIQLFLFISKIQVQYKSTFHSVIYSISENDRKRNFIQTTKVLVAEDAIDFYRALCLARRDWQRQKSKEGTAPFSCPDLMGTDWIWGFWYLRYRAKEGNHSSSDGTGNVVKKLLCSSMLKGNRGTQMHSGAEIKIILPGKQKELLNFV